MRSNSGRDDGRNNVRDPTVRDRTIDRSKSSRASRKSSPGAPADHRGGRKD